MEKSLQYQRADVSPSDYLIEEIERANSRRIADNFFRRGEIILIVTPKLREGKDRCQRTAAATGPARTLLVVGHGGRDIAHSHIEQAANIDAHFHCRGH